MMPEPRKKNILFTPEAITVVENYRRTCEEIPSFTEAVNLLLEECGRSKGLTPDREKK